MGYGAEASWIEEVEAGGEEEEALAEPEPEPGTGDGRLWLKTQWRHIKVIALFHVDDVKVCGAFCGALTTR
jgi:hypothetical protein